MRTLKLWLALLVAVVGVGIAPSAVNAATPATGCHVFSVSVAKGVNDGFSPIYTVPSTSSCNDIQINHMSNPAHAARAFLVLFYPSSGEPYVGNTHVVPYNSSSYTVLATAVLNGTRFSLQEELAGAEAWSATCED